MTTLYLVRHGETEWNDQGLIQGSVDVSLSHVGREQAAKLAQRLKDTTFRHIYTSPQKRAYQTMEAIAKFHPTTPVTVRRDLAEYSLGVLEGMTINDVKTQFKEKNWDKESFRRRTGAESYNFYQRHFRRYLPVLLRQHDGHSVLFSTHGGKMKGILKSLFPRKYYRDLQMVHPKNCSVTVVEWNENTGAKMVLHADTSHLDV